MATTVTLGRKPATRDPDYGQITVNDRMRLSVFDRIDNAVWLRRIGGIVGRAGGSNVEVRFVCYRGSSSHVPSSRIAYVGVRTVSTVMTTFDGGIAVDYQIEVSDTGPSTKGAFIPANAYVAFGYECDSGAPMGHGMIAASKITADDENFYDIDGVSTPPGTYPGTYSKSNQGHLSAWGIADHQVAPEVPINRSPSGLITDLTPAFSASFRDQNGAYGGSKDAGDVLVYTEIELRNNSTGSVIWNPVFPANAGEVASNEFGPRTYNGPALVRGTEYAWRIRMQDYAGDWSVWSSWLTLQVAIDNYITLTGPTGRQTTLTPTMTGRWNSSLNTNAMRVIIKAGTTVIGDSGYKTTTVNANTDFSLTWAFLGFSATALEWGVKYTANVQGRATDGTVSDFVLINFNTNDAPKVPSDLRPSTVTNDGIQTSPPVLSCVCSDPDPENPVASLTVKARLYDDATDALLSTLIMAYNGTTKRFEVASGVSIKKAYFFRCYSFDGNLYSGKQLVEPGALSAPAMFEYKDGPVLAITAPTSGSVISNSATPLVWTCATQTKYFAEYWSNGVKKFETGWVTSTAKTWTPPVGLAAPGATVEYRLRVTDATTLEDSETTTVTLTYPPIPAATGFTASPYTLSGEPQPTAIWLAWEQWTGSGFVAYWVYRDDEADPFAVLSAVTNTVLIDYAPRAGIDHQYRLVVVAAQSGAQNQSLPAYASSRVVFDGIVLYAENAPTSLRIVSRAWDERNADQDGGDLAIKTWAPTAPITVRDQGVWYQSLLTIPLYDDDAGPAFVKRDMVAALGAAGGPLVYKTGYAVARRVSIPGPRGVAFTDQRNNLMRASIVLRDEAAAVWT